MDISTLRRSLTLSQRRELLRLTDDYIEALSALIPDYGCGFFSVWDAAIDLAAALRELEDERETLINNDPTRYDHDLFGGA